MISSSRPFRIQLLPGTDVVVTVVSQGPNGWVSEAELSKGPSALNLSRLHQDVHQQV